MLSNGSGAGREILEEQKQHWEDSFARKPKMFGAQPSDPALPIIEKWAVEVAGFGVVPLPSAATTEMLF